MNAWFWNISADDREFFVRELEQGRLRQGWGYAPSLNLRKIQRKLNSGEALDRAEQRAWERCYHMLERIQIGDLVTVKNLPRRRHFTIVRVTGGYEFQMPAIGDFAHVLPVEIVRTFDKNSALVPGRFAAALDREQHPIRVTYKHSTTVRDLARSEDPEGDGRRPEGFKEKLDRWQESLLEPLHTLLRRDLTHKEAERLVQGLLQHEGLDTTFTAGPQERGADVVSEVGMAGSLSGLSVELAVQVKMRWGTDNHVDGVQQLIRAIEERGVDAGLLVTFGDKLGPDLVEAISEAKRQYRIDVLYGSALYKALLRYLADSGWEEV